MENETERTVKHQVKNLLAVVGSGFLCAFLIAIMMLYYYGPTGRYYVKNILISPEVLPEMNYNDSNSKTNKNSRFIFNGIELSFYDRDAKRVTVIPVTENAYRKFYHMIEQDGNVDNPSDDLKLLFEKEGTATLVITVKTESKADWQMLTKGFQQVQLSKEGDDYRIELHDQNQAEKWVYFHHPKIYQEAMNILISP